MLYLHHGLLRATQGRIATVSLGFYTRSDDDAHHILTLVPQVELEKLNQQLNSLTHILEDLRRQFDKVMS